MSLYGQAEALKLAAMRAAEEVNARNELVSQLGDLVIVYIGLGRMDLAYDYADRMVKLATELDNQSELSRGRGNRGYTLLALGRYEEALADIEVSLNRYREQDRLEGTIVTTIDMVMYLRITGQEEQATELARRNYEAALQQEYPKLRIVAGRCLALFLPPPERRILLQQTVALARDHGRPMDEAGCLFSLAAIAKDEREGDDFYARAVALLGEMGCPGWLEGKSRADPPLLPMMI